MFVSMDFKVKNPDQLPVVAASILEKFSQERIFLFFGQMGAGKTTFIKAFCAELGIIDAVSSPTYSIVNEYKSAKGKVYHFDFYRLKAESEALDMGYEEYFYSGDYCLIEWPEKISNLWPDEYVKIEIEILADTKRRIAATNHNLRSVNI